MNYTTQNGYDLTLGRIPRVTVDQFIVNHPMPVPPMRAVPVFGGVDEDIPDTEDPEYQAEYGRWINKFGNAQVGLILPAIEFEIDQRFLDLQEISEFTIEQCVRSFVLEYGNDFTNVVNLVLYNSTVTQQAIDEAMTLFGVTWYDQDVAKIITKQSPGKYRSLFESREAARFANYSWHEFCELSGPEQSAIVAHYRLEKKLQWLMSQK